MAYRRRSRNMYKPGAGEPFRLSRSRIDRFIECPRCFYLDRRMGFDRPSMPGWSLNSAVDELLKKEFDILRKDGEQHPLMHEYGIDLVPYNHPDVPLWRGEVNKFSGAKILHEPTNLEIDGLIDDVWVDENEVLYIVDYKSTSTNREIDLNGKYKKRYKRQMEIYQWIFRQLEFEVSDVGYFVYANGIKDNETFDAKLEFDISILPYEGDDSWVEPTIFDIKETLDANEVPEPGEECEYCPYRTLIAEELGEL